MAGIVLNSFMVQAASGGATVPPTPTFDGGLTPHEDDVDFWLVDGSFTFANNGGATITAAEVQIDSTPTVDGWTGQPSAPYKFGGNELNWAFTNVALNTSEGIPPGSHVVRARGMNSVGWSGWVTQVLNI